jgi:hypothetical protein
MATDTNVTTKFPSDIHIHLSQEQAGGYQKDGHGRDESNVELNRLGRESDRAAVEGVKERSPSPHCHFALPRLPSSSGTISRRSSLSIGARTRVGIIGQGTFCL